MNKKTMKNVLLPFCVIFSTALAGSAPAYAETALARIQSSGTLTACIKKDYRPFGYIDDKGENVGYEIDLIDDLAKKLSAKFGKPIKVEKLPVVASNRIQFLQQGRCDVLAATMNDTPEREKILDIAKPGYYAVGPVLMVPMDSTIKSWKDAEGKKICTSSGAFWNAKYTQEFKFEFQPYTGLAPQVAALADKRCVAVINDSAAINDRLQNGEDGKLYKIVGEPHDVQPWALATQKGNTELLAFLEKVNAEWHASGFLLKEAEKWNVPKISWMTEMQEKYRVQNPVK